MSYGMGFAQQQRLCVAGAQSSASAMRFDAAPG